MKPSTKSEYVAIAKFEQEAHVGINKTPRRLIWKRYRNSSLEKSEDAFDTAQKPKFKRLALHFRIYSQVFQRCQGRHRKNLEPEIQDSGVQTGSCSISACIRAIKKKILTSTPSLIFFQSNYTQTNTERNQIRSRKLNIAEAKRTNQDLVASGFWIAILEFWNLVRLMILSLSAIAAAVTNYAICNFLRKKRCLC